MNFLKQRRSILKASIRYRMAKRNYEFKIKYYCKDIDVLFAHQLFFILLYFESIACLEIHTSDIITYIIIKDK